MAAAAPMTIHLELWQLLTFLIGLLITFLGAAFGFGKLLLGQLEKRLDAQFSAQDEQRRVNQAHLDTKLESLEKTAREEQQEWKQIERDLMALKAQLPLDYVRREDHIISQSRIEAKIDGLSNKIDAIPTGIPHGR